MIKRSHLRGQWFQDWLDLYGHPYRTGPFVPWSEYLAEREREEAERVARQQAEDEARRLAATATAD